jgi:Ca2+-binding RTX toxin-like protein
VGLDRTILIDSDGARPVHLPRAEDVAWSPDGARFYYGNGEAVHVATAYAGESTKLVPADRFALSPDGARLALIAMPDDSDCFEEQSAFFELASRTSVSPESCWIGGSAYDDELIGRAAAPDEIDGFDGRDRLYGRGGADLIKGWEGADRLYGGAGRDYVRAGPGNDRAFTADGEHDVLDCGPGRDRAVVDALDSVARNCERFERR